VERSCGKCRRPSRRDGGDTGIDPGESGEDFKGSEGLERRDPPAARGGAHKEARPSRCSPSRRVGMTLKRLRFQSYETSESEASQS